MSSTHIPLELKHGLGPTTTLLRNHLLRASSGRQKPHSSATSTGHDCTRKVYKLTWRNKGEFAQRCNSITPPSQSPSSQSRQQPAGSTKCLTNKHAQQQYNGGLPGHRCVAHLYVGPSQVMAPHIPLWHDLRNVTIQGATRRPHMARTTPFSALRPQSCQQRR